jgi:hypothetical protein
MRRPRFQHSIRHLLGLIAVCAVCFALLRTPIGFVALRNAGLFGVWASGVLPGFLIARARNGHGVFGGALSFSAWTGLLVLALVTFPAFDLAPPVPSFGNTILVSLRVLCVVCPSAFAFGLLVSGALYLIVEVTQIVLQVEPIARASGPRRLYPEPDSPVRFDDPQAKRS